jgi:hypothetical protein
LTYRNYD